MENKSTEIPYIRSRVPWNDLPQQIRAKFNNDEKKWEEFVINFSISNQLSYRYSSVSFYIPKEETYYNQLIQNSRSNLLLYPYHLQLKIVRLFNITAYAYYIEMFVEQFSKEKNYDVIPNFTANDCLQLLGIGRNQYIDISNEYKSKKSWLMIKKPFKQRLPRVPRVWESWEPWWIVKAGSILVSDMEDCNPEERLIIDQLIDKNGIECGLLDKNNLTALFIKNLVILEVPINIEDHFIVPKLENFVMNRIQGDYMESLMYKVIVTLDEDTSLTDLSALLDADIAIIKQAVSLFCRLGMIYKKHSIFDQSTLHPTWIEYVQSSPLFYRTYQEKYTLTINNGSNLNLLPESCPSSGSMSERVSIVDEQQGRNIKRIAFIYDSNLTAFLMLGNLSQELKTYAMTMFEMGKLTHEMMNDFMDKLSQTTVQSEGEAKHYYVSVMNLLKTLKFLKRRSKSVEEWYDEQVWLSQNSIPVDMIHNESLKNLSRMAMLKHLSKKYTILVSMAPVSSVLSPVSCSHPISFGPPLPEFNSFWYRLFLYKTVKSGPPSILIPRGNILIVMPYIFKGYESIYVASPDQPPIILSSSHSIHLINDILRHSCVFLQGFSHNLEIQNKLVHLSFPFEKIILEKCDRVATFLSTLSSEHNLERGFGVVTLMRIEKQDETLKQERNLLECTGRQYGSNVSLNELLPNDSYAQPNLSFYYENTEAVNNLNYKDIFSDERYDWIPFEIVHGIPLFNDFLNESICEKISAHDLFGPKSAQIYVNENRKIILRFIDFILKYGGLRSELSKKALSDQKSKNYVFLPTKPVMFYEGNISLWSIHCEL